MLKRQPRAESLADKMHRYRGVLLVISAPILLVAFVLYMMPSTTEDIEIASRKSVRGPLLRNPRNYVVIFDAGSSGSRVHVFCFDRKMDLVPLYNELEVFHQLKPGLSAYPDDPIAAANSISSLLDKAQGVVPKELRPKTPVRVGATAGLRTLGNERSEKILQAVRNLLRDRSTLKSEDDGVIVLDGSQEGSYQWVTINYLLGKLGRKYSDTVGIVDLGGGSVQMAYAISEEDAANAPKVVEGEDQYVKPLSLKGTKYYLYVHSYLLYGLLAARAEILKISDNDGNPCIMPGYDGFYNYGGKTYKATASSSDSRVGECRSLVLQVLKKNDTTCTHMRCTFNGIWNGGRGDGQKNLFVASFFYDRAAEAGFIDKQQPAVIIQPAKFDEAAQRACKSDLAEAKSTFPQVEESNLPYLCMDLVYQYTLLVDGFGLDKWQEITLVKQIQYQNSLVEAAWPLGSAIEAVSAHK